MHSRLDGESKVWRCWMAGALAMCAGAGVFGAPGSLKAQGASMLEGGLPGGFGPLLLGLEADYTEDAAALALRLDRPFRLNEETVFLVELYGAKADQSFGILSGGLALRRIVSDSGTWLGLNVFYDALQDSDRFSYSQIGVGGEVAYRFLTFRTNAYLPVGDSEDVRTKSRSRTSERLVPVPGPGGAIGTSISTVEFSEISRFSRSAAWQWEAEVEAAIPNAPEWFSPSLALGYYIIDAGGDYPRYSGLKARGEVRFGRHVSADVEWRQDAREIGQEWRTRLRFEFLLGAPTVSERRAESGDATLAAADGKTVRSFAAGKSAKSFEPARAADPAGFEGRVKRTPWPQVLNRREDSQVVTYRGSRLLDPGMPGTSSGATTRRPIVRPPEDPIYD